MKYEDISLEGKVALVTGSSRGIGKGVALELGSKGATVYVTGRTTELSNAPTALGKKVVGTVGDTAQEINELGGKGIAVQCDHGNDDDVKKLFDRIARDHEGLDILVNNAFPGAEFIEQLGKNAWELPDPLGAWDMIHRVGLRSAYAASVLAVPHMIKRRSGLITNISSYAAVEYVHNVSNGTAKAGLDKLAHDLGHELKPHNIPYVSLWAGANRTELVGALTEQEDLKEHISPLVDDEAPADEVPAGNTEHPRFSGRAVTALYSDENRMALTGQAIPVAQLALDYGYTDLDGAQPPVYRNHEEAAKFFPAA